MAITRVVPGSTLVAVVVMEVVKGVEKGTREGEWVERVSGSGTGEPSI